MENKLHTTKQLPAKRVVRSAREGDIGEEVDLPGFVRLTNLPATEYLAARTNLIMQRYLVTDIETSITREEAAVLVQAIVEHFDLAFEDIA